MYYEYREPVAKIPSHRMLAIRRGEAENMLYFNIELSAERAARLSEKQGSQKAGRVDSASGTGRTGLLQAPAQSLDPVRSPPGVEAEAPISKPSAFFARIWKICFCRRPPGQIAVLGIDPGIRTGCKIAVVDETGKFLDHSVIYPHQPKNDFAGSARILKELMAKYNVSAVAIGNGTASRETDAFVRDFFSQEGLVGRCSASR